MGSFHSISEMELEEHDSEDICFTPPASHIEKILRKDLHGWMFDDWVIGLREITMSIGHFRVSRTLSFKKKLGAKPSL